MLHDTTWRPRTLLDWLKGYRYTPKCHINVADCFNHVGIPRTVPSQPCCYFLRRYPQIRVRIYRTPKTVPQFKAGKSIQLKTQLWTILRYTSLYKIPQQSRQFCDRWIWNWLFNAGSRNVAVSKSRHRLLFSPTWIGQKHSKIPYEIVSRFGR